MRWWHRWRAGIWDRRLRAARLTATWSPDVAGAWDIVQRCQVERDFHLSRLS